MWLVCAFILKNQLWILPAQILPIFENSKCHGLSDHSEYLESYEKNVILAQKKLLDLGQ